MQREILTLIYQIILFHYFIPTFIWIRDWQVSLVRLNKKLNTQVSLKIFIKLLGKKTVNSFRDDFKSQWEHDTHKYSLRLFVTKCISSGSFS